MKHPLITGTYQAVGAFGRVIPHDRREIKEVLILQGAEGGAVPGDQVAVELLPETSYRNIRRRAGVEQMGKVVEVLGRQGDVGAAEKALIRRLGLREKFPKRVWQAGEKMPQSVSEKEREGRLDLRQELIFTIDGEDTRDIDDAVSLKVKAEGGWQLGVHIADVSHYVSAGSALDREAYLRGTSVYFPDLVLPMLPPALSNGICSLNPGEERLAVSCLMEVSPKGEVTKYQIRPSVISSREKLSYPQVQAYYNRCGFRTKEVLAGGRSPVQAKTRAEDYFSQEAIGESLLEMARLCLVLRTRRLARGALDFELPECRIVIEEKGGPKELLPKHRMLSEMVIEEFMILANETVAGHYRAKGVPFPYRIHSQPAGEKIFALNRFLQPLGLFLKGERKEGREGTGPGSQKQKTAGVSVTPRSYQQLLQQIKGQKEETVVSAMLLRSLSHAVYSPEEEGHFGLASDCYCHFTSPIRRYPDLLVHRIIKEYGMKGRPDQAAAKGQRQRLEEQCARASLCEQAAEEAERKAESLWKAAYMERFLGQEFDARISGVTAYGLYVALENTVEGLIHVSTMADYYEFDEKTQTLSSWRRQKSYRMGDDLRVRLVSVDVGAGYVDFVLAESETPAGNKEKPAASPGRPGKEAPDKGGVRSPQQEGRPGDKVRRGQPFYNAFSRKKTGGTGSGVPARKGERRRRGPGSRRGREQ